MTTKNRPVYLDLTQFRFPIAAIMSVGHRASGVLMILAIPFLAYALDLSLSGPEGFAEAKMILDGLFIKLVLFVVLWALLHHLLAGIRFLLIDIHLGVEKEIATKSAQAVMVAAPVLAVLIGLVLL
ncbi:succinate dehydrogenase, cytochrome b556 subunit [Sedimenticola hydrogenitrophicus]|jgi:succinate dehydrogenase / fumarate reductase cytochrome b subunit|uniref:succinate dehydrogenase, cytochrome b556 subunit n=1 Tax=Sedimenticola hydrogenitrophicus TaxID=2967975 RepID=UPI0021A32A4F|nr:succinate dehydrogenase, cytochrome b556 subunit [Sedimenticola hydrogenitrophicus]